MGEPHVRSVEVRSPASLPEAMAKLVADLDPGLPAEFAGRRVLLKANFNSPHRYPATSAPEALAALVALLRSAGAAEIRIGDSCGLRWAPAARVAEALGVPALAARLGVEWVDFDAGPWVDVPVGGRFFPKVRLAEAAVRAECIVYCCCVKTHPAARFSASLKHAIGFLAPEQRAAMHRGDMAERIAEINAAGTPRLVVADARKCFAAGGPAVGWVRRSGLLLASADRVALDCEAVRILRGFRPRLHRLAADPEDEPQIRAARALRLAPAGGGS